MFARPHHRAVLRALEALDSDLLLGAECWFGGGTAIVLELDEYRESRDIDFLCASTEGWRRIREAVWARGLDGLLKPGAALPALRDLRSDQYGVRTILDVEGAAIRFEIVREARIALSGAFDPRYGVPLLSREDMYAEKLLANADRGADRATLSRDAIDLSMMIARWGPIPEAALAKARAAYGGTVEEALARSFAMIREEAWLARCMAEMGMDAALAEEITGAQSS